jgi:hypothetical protein
LDSTLALSLGFASLVASFSETVQSTGIRAPITDIVHRLYYQDFEHAQYSKETRLWWPLGKDTQQAMLHLVEREKGVLAESLSWTFHRHSTDVVVPEGCVSDITTRVFQHFRDLDFAVGVCAAEMPDWLDWKQITARLKNVVSKTRAVYAAPKNIYYVEQSTYILVEVSSPLHSIWTFACPFPNTTPIPNTPTAANILRVVEAIEDCGRNILEAK